MNVSPFSDARLAGMHVLRRLVWLAIEASAVTVVACEFFPAVLHTLLRSLDERDLAGHTGACS